MDNIIKEAQRIIEGMSADTKNEFLMNCMRNNCDTLFLFFKKWRGENPNPSEYDCVAQCMLQMIITNSQSILSLANGIKIIPQSEATIVDPTSMISILRTLYERVFIFHNIFIQTANEEERRILFNIWQTRGLNNRQNLKVIQSQYKEKAEKERNEILKLRDESIALLENISITNDAKNELSKYIKSDSSNIVGFIFMKDDNGKIITIKRVALSDSPAVLFTDNSLSNFYAFLSLHSHPSYLGTLQFGQMFNSSEDKSLLSSILMSALVFQNIFAKDFCSFVKGAKEAWDNGHYELLTDGFH